MKLTHDFFAEYRFFWLVNLRTSEMYKDGYHLEYAEE